MQKFNCLLILFSSFFVFGQTVVTSDTAITKDIDSYLKLSKDYQATQIDSSLYFVNRALVLAQNANDINIDAKLRAHKAGILITMRHYEEAENLLNQNINTREINRSIMGMTHNNIGALFYHQQGFENAIKHYLEAANMLDQPENSGILRKVFANIGGIHARLGNSQKAIHYMNKALELVDKDDTLKMQILSNLSGVYFDEKNIDKAISTAHEAQELAQEQEAVPFLGLIYSNLCRFYLKKEKYNTSIDFGTKSLAIKKNLNQNTDIVMNNLGYAFLQSGDNSKALYYLNQVLPHAKGELKSLIYNNLSQAHQNMGNYRKAYGYLEQNIRIKDSINLAAQRANVEELTERYESEKKQQQIDLLNTNNELNQSKLKEQRNLIWAMAIFVLSGIALGLLVYRNQKINLSLNASKIKNKLLQTQLNPHFLFNALNSMQGFNYADEKKKLSDYINSFSKLMRSILESSDQDFITIEEDANAIREYITLQRLSSEGKFSSNIAMEENLDLQTLIPPMFTQPFVENAVLHGMKNLKKGVIDIKYQRKGTGLIFIIKDNGAGFSAKSPNNEEKLHRSMGIDILKERIANLRKTHGYKCEMQTASSDSGTTVTLTFPLLQKK